MIITTTFSHNPAMFSERPLKINTGSKARSTEKLASGYRITELAVKSSNDTNSAHDHAYMDSEVQQLKQEMRNLFKTAQFNELPIWQTPTALTFWYLIWALMITWGNG